jgi:hypothetical protein
MQKAEDFDNFLNQSLEQMELEYIDFYHLPYLSFETWNKKVLPLGLIDRAEKAKSKGLIRHFSFSTHDSPDGIRKLIDTGVFSTMLAQYNILDRVNEDVFAYAKSKGLGTIVMGPLMGGVFSDGGKAFLERMESKASNASELGLRFVWSLPAVDMVLSGMSDMRQLEENVAYAAKAGVMSTEERQMLIDRSHVLKELNDLYCTSCDYCVGCPQKIQIGQVFNLYLQHHVWGLTDAVRKRRGEYNPWVGPWVDPNVCKECGACVEKCPQNIDIPAELKRVWPIVSSL